MFYVCNKRGNKYGVVDTDDGICEYYLRDDLLKISESVQIVGVSEDKINVVDKDFIIAKAKLLGVELINTDYISFDKCYNLVEVHEYNMYLRDVDSDSRIRIKNYRNHIDFILSRGVKIINLWNNVHFRGTNEFSELSLSTVVYIDYKFMSLNDCLERVKAEIGKETTLDSYSYIQEVHRVSTSKMVILFHFMGGVRYYEVDLSKGSRSVRKITDKRASSLINKYGVISLRFI